MGCGQPGTREAKRSGEEGAKNKFRPLSRRLMVWWRGRSRGIAAGLAARILPYLSTLNSVSVPGAQRRENATAKRAWCAIFFGPFGSFASSAPLDGVLQNGGYGQVHLVSLDIAVLIEDVHVLDLGALNVAKNPMI